MNVPLRRTALDRLIRNAGGTALPGDNQMDKHLNELLDEMAGIVGDVNLAPQNDGQVAHAAMATTTITYDPNYTEERQATVDAPFRTACILHELMHFSVDWKYTHPPATLAQDMPWSTVNFHYGASPAFSFAAQSQTIYQNLGQAAQVAAADNSITSAVRTHVAWRLEYGQVTPNVHNETVLLDLLVYLRLLNMTQSRTYRYLSTLSQEARTRRNDSVSPVRLIPS